MTEQPTVWRATGLYWTNQNPGLGLVDPTGTERTQPITTGTKVGYQLGGKRHCIGIWLAQQQRSLGVHLARPWPPAQRAAT